MTGKKRLCLLTAVLMVLAVLAGCSGGGAAPAQTPAGGNGAASGGGAAAPVTSDINYPEKPIEIICPYSAGGGQDIWARITANYMEKYMPAGTKFVVNNISAGGGIAGGTAIASASPDGYQLGAIVPFQLTDQFINVGTPYTEESFYPLGFGASDGNFLIANPSLGFETAQDLIDYALANPGQLTFGVGGAYNSHDFFRWKIELETGIEVNRMPFDGGALVLAAVAGGNCDVGSVSISEALAALEEGTIVALATSEDARTPLAPDVPTMVESGVNVIHAQWRCITCPPDTPQEIKDMLVEALDKTYADPEWQAELEQAGFNVINVTGEDALAFYQTDFAEYKNLVQSLGITAN